MAPQASAARRTTPKTEAETEKANVVMSAEARESLGSRMASIEGAQEGFAHAIGEMDERIDTKITTLTAKMDEFTTNMGHRYEQISNDQAQLNERVDFIREGLEHEKAVRYERERRFKDEVEDDAELVGNLITKNARRVRRFVRKGRPTKDTLPAIVVANVAEYLTLVTAAQIAPVQVGNMVTAALFL